MSDAPEEKPAKKKGKLGKILVIAVGALVLVGGVLLMLPGLLTDVIGLFFLIPFTRPLARRVVGFFVARRLHRAGFGGLTSRGPGAGTVVEGEVVPDADTETVVVTPQQIEGGRPPG